uniref:hypothetical protein n=1 Tax=Streptomyces sp. NBC_00998 TaxID=2903712 RepID=UPI002F91B4A6|nr:hypothetical protein OG513_39440 [Streptomyces sp. NBC_00998]
MSDWSMSDERSAIRLLAVWLLLERSEQALSKGPRTPGDPAPVEGGQLPGWPPAPHPCPDSWERGTLLRELAILLGREFNGKARASDTRRIAELLELFGRDDWALSWWQKAAEGGDEDARDYLEILREEAAETVSPPSDPPGDPTFLGDSAAFVVWKASSMAAGSDTFAAVQVALQAATRPHQDAERLVEQVEEYLRHPDRMTDGRRL